LPPCWALLASCDHYL